MGEPETEKTGLWERRKGEGSKGEFKAAQRPYRRGAKTNYILRRMVGGGLK